MYYTWAYRDIGYMYTVHASEVRTYWFSSRAYTQNGLRCVQGNMVDSIQSPSERKCMTGGDFLDIGQAGFHSLTHNEVVYVVVSAPYSDRGT